LGYVGVSYEARTSVIVRAAPYPAAVVSGGSSVIDVLGWALVAATGAVVVTQLTNWAGSRIVAIVQSFTPYLVVMMLPLGATALAAGRIGLAVAAVAIGLAGAWTALPLLRPYGQPPTAPDTERVRIAAVNLLYTNDRMADVAADLAARDLDVIMFSEYTPAHQRDLLESSLTRSFAHRTDRADSGGSGIAIWSRTPVAVAAHPDTRNYSLDVTVATGTGPIRVIAVHPPTPVADFDEWRRDLATIGALGLTSSDADAMTETPPDDETATAIVGDFNASFWHPSFRKLLDLGYVDAHTARRRGLSVSWPDDGRCPAFVRLDHALVNRRLAVEAVDDIDVPGSDHRGFIVTVARAQ
jgi:endonuclease/exonuclease/phosphatase (EEP) superfamily protein YafD